MTCRERLALEHPEKIDDHCDGGCNGCPSSYEYLPAPKWCNFGDARGYAACTTCWDREIPEYKEFVDANLELAEGVGISEDIIDKFNEIGNVNVISHRDLKSAIKDSGNRREFETGAVRDIQEGKGRCDLMPLDVVSTYMKRRGKQASTLNPLTLHCYAPIHHISDFQKTGSADHLYCALQEFVSVQNCWHSDEDMFLEVAIHFEEGAKKYGEYNWQKGIPVHCYIDSAVRHYLKYLRGDKDESHDRAFVWNIMCCIWTCKHKPEMNDYAKKENNDG